jgi:hypothetical protein
MLGSARTDLVTEDTGPRSDRRTLGDRLHMVVGVTGPAVEDQQRHRPARVQITSHPVPGPTVVPVNDPLADEPITRSRSREDSGSALWSGPYEPVVDGENGPQEACAE